jgi:hypothetical protein
MSNPATTADLVSRWRPLSTLETTNGQTFLNDAYVMLSRRFVARNAVLDDLLDDDEDEFKAAVRRVMATAVLRIMKNPDGLVREKIDDYEWQRGQAVADGLLYFTDEELDELLPGAGVKGRAYSLDPFAGRDWDEIPR